MEHNTNRVIQVVRAYNSKKKNGSMDEYLDHHTTMAGMMRTTIKLREPFMLPMNMFNMDSHLKKMLETTEEERAEADDVFKCAFPDSYSYWTLRMKQANNCFRIFIRATSA